MSRSFLALAPIALATAIAGCSGNAPSAPEVTVLARSEHCGLNLSWQRIRASSELPAALPQVGIFEDSTTLVISMGRQPTGGFEIILPEATTPNPDGPGIQLHVRLEAPPPDAMVTQALTSPCALLRIDTPPDTPLEVHFSGTAAEAASAANQRSQ
ncbi:MAG: protease complex subunit PrcB family protein [Gammaproteobacteria bacterium]|nr:protease complex subunit PrcB family protein [Gammaproteobacteria bacterium]